MSITSPLNNKDSQDHINMKKLKHVQYLEEFKKNSLNYEANRKETKNFYMPKSH